VDEAELGVPRQGTGQQVRLAEDLEAVADAEHWQPRRAAGTSWPSRGEPGDRSAPEVIAVGEAAGEDHRVHTAQIPVVMQSETGIAPA